MGILLVVVSYQWSVVRCLPRRLFIIGQSIWERWEIGAVADQKEGEIYLVWEAAFGEIVDAPPRLFEYAHGDDSEDEYWA
jgi:hypothetical protein